MSHGMEHWHPNPGFFFRSGAGPVFDMGPYYLSALVTLLGPVASVQAAGKIGFEERIVTAPESPVHGQSIKVETLTDVHALLDFESGAHVTFMASWDVWKHGVPPIELHGQLASLRLPDPNWFGGELADRREGPGLADDPHRRQDFRHEKLAGGGAEIREQPWARLSGHGAGDSRSAAPPRQRRDRPACPRGHGGDSRGGHGRSAGL